MRKKYRVVRIGATLLCMVVSSTKTEEMHLKIGHTIVFMLLLVSACTKQRDSAAKRDTSGEHTYQDSGLTGTWQWVRTDGGIAYNIHDTPLSTGKQVVLKISADSSYAVYTNGALTTNGTYGLETKTCIHDHTNKTFINFSAGPGKMVEKCNSGDLLLSDDYPDGLEYQYTRVPESYR